MDESIEMGDFKLDMDLDLDLDTDLDMSWAEDFLEEDSKYADFYEENVTFVQLRVVYVDKESEIVKVKQEMIQLMSPNCVSREELLYIIKTNRMHENKHYEMLSIAKFNMDLRASDLKSFLKSSQTQLGDIYLSTSHEVDKITFNKTIGALQTLNELLIIFYDVKPTIKPNMNVTKRIRFTPARNKTAKQQKITT
jgi:hypothetical protein